ncbi:MAG: hypothetical protein GVY13_10630 [Alphaproteobacteria bacterium]|nr:hypothetical protein [Alphaproteobacteria bacterium]
MRDADLVLGAKTILEELGHSVYVDWIDDPQLDRGKVNRETAALLRARMTCCASLMYLHTRNSPSSKWMPWELGYFDGHNGNVAILPIIGNADSDTFQGQEYLGLYPYVDITGIRGATGQAAWVNKSVSQYIALRSWKTGDRDWRLAG